MRNAYLNAFIFVLLISRNDASDYDELYTTENSTDHYNTTFEPLLNEHEWFRLSCELNEIIWDGNVLDFYPNQDTFADNLYYRIQDGADLHHQCFPQLNIPVCCDSPKCYSSVNAYWNLNGVRVLTSFQTRLVDNFVCPPHETLTTLEQSAVELRVQNQSLYVVSQASETSYFCLQPNSSSIRSCVPSPTIEACTGKCVRKCCPTEQIYDYSLNKCTYLDLQQVWVPNFHDLNLNPMTNVPIAHGYDFGFPVCSQFFALNPKISPKNEFFLLDNGSIYVTQYGSSYDHLMYCIDHFKKGETIDEEALLCFPELKPQDETCKHIHSRIYPGLLATSVFFLVLTLVVYSLLPELNSKLNGRCVMANTATLLVGYVCLIINEWAKSMSMLTCRILGLSTQFFILASFFWMNIMCFDVWRALRSTRFAYGKPSTVNRRFLKFFAYAFGCPFLISLATACVQFIPSASTKQYLVDPGFGLTGCFFNANDSRPWWVYFYGFILAVMLVNTILFVHLLLMLHRDRMNADAALHRRKRKHVMWLKLYVKLFFLMGVTWIFEVISWIEGSCKLWIWIDSINALRGFFIFLIFVCKRSIWKKLQNDNVIMSSFRSTTSSKSSKRSQFYVDIKVAETPA